MSMPGLGRTVLELATDTSGFYGELDKAERRVVNLGGVFDKTGKTLQNVGTGAKSFGENVNRAMVTADTGTQRFSTSLKSLGAAMAGFVSVRAITAAVSSFTDLTGKLTDLSAKTGISTGELQKLKYAAELSGGSLESVTKVIGVMARNLIEGDKGAVAATKRLGLNLMELREMQPGEAFNTIAEAISKIPNKMEQITVGTQLMGRGFSDVLPMITGGLTEAFQAAERLGIVMDEETVAAGDRLGDTFTTLSTVGQGVIGKVLGPMVPAIQMVADAMTGLGDLVIWLQGAFTTLLKWGIQALKFFVDAAIKVTEFAASVPILGKTMRDVDKAALESAKSWSVFFDDMAKGMDVVAPKVTKQTTSLKTAVGLLTAEQTKNAKATDAQALAMKKLQEELSGAGAIKAALELVDALKKMPPIQNLTDEAQKRINETMGKAIDVFKALGVTAPAAITATYLATLQLGKTLPIVTGLGKEFEKIGSDTWQRTWTRSIPIVNGLGKEFQNVGEKVAVIGLQGPNAFDRIADSVIGLSGALQELARHSTGAFGVIVAEIANLVNAMDKGRAAGEQLKAGGFTNTVQGSIAGAAAIGQATSTGGMKSRVAKGAVTGASIGAAFGPAGMAIGAGVGALVGYIRSLGQGRKAVEEFAKAHGGFDALQARLQALGAGGEKLWIALTQGVGRNNPEQAKQVVAEVAAKMEALEKAQARFNTGLTTALQGIMEWGGRVPDALKPYLDQLREAGRLTEENMALLDALADGGAVDWEKMQATAEKYGIEIGGLGQAFQEQRLHAGWQELIDDADLLVRGGADVNAMLAGMADEISKLVQESIRFGTDIPENMRPYIEALIASGQLLDENGEKITDIGQLKFGETLQTSLQKLTEEIKKMIDALNGVPAALGLIPRSVDVDVNVRRNTRNADDDTFGEWRPDGGTPGERQPSYAALGGRVTTRGIQRFNMGGVVGMRTVDADEMWNRWGLRLPARGTDTEVAMLTPGEIVLNDNQQKAVGALVASALGGESFSGGGGGGPIRSASSDSAAASARTVGPVTASVNIYAMDGASVERVVKSRDFGEALKRAFTNDTNGLRNHLEVVLA